MIIFSIVAATVTYLDSISLSIDEWFTTLVSLNFSYVLITVMMLQMTVFTYWIYQRVKVINATLTRMSVSRDIQINHPYLQFPSLKWNANGIITKDCVDILLSLSDTHYELIALTNLLDDIYGDGIFVLLILLIIDSLLVSHKIFADYQNNVDVLDGILESWFELSRVISLLGEITAVVIPCSSIKRVVS